MILAHLPSRASVPIPTWVRLFDNGAVMVLAIPDDIFPNGTIITKPLGTKISPQVLALMIARYPWITATTPIIVGLASGGRQTLLAYWDSVYQNGQTYDFDPS